MSASFPSIPLNKSLALLLFIFQPAWLSLRGASRFGELEKGRIRGSGRDCLASKESKGKRGETPASQCIGTSWPVSKCLFHVPVLGSPSSELVSGLCGGEVLEMNSSNSDAGSVSTTAPGGPPHQLE